MKVSSVLLSILLLLPGRGRCDENQWIDSSEAARQVSMAVTNGDATGSFYYFFYTPANGDRIRKVRILWNGGAQNPPTVTDYYLEGDSVTVIERSAARKDLPVLLRGEDSGLTTKKEMKFKSESAKITLTSEQSIALGNLIDAMSMARSAVPAPAANTGKPTEKPKSK
jgi:hypothetical protein